MAVAIALGSLTGSTISGTAAQADPLPVIPANPYELRWEGGDGISKFSCDGFAIVVEVNSTDTGYEIVGEAETQCTVSGTDPWVPSVGVHVELFIWDGAHWVSVAGTQPNGSYSTTMGNGSVKERITYSGNGSPRACMAMGYHAGTGYSSAVHSGWSTSASTYCGPACEKGVTIADLKEIFGAEIDNQTVRDGLPSLNAEMKARNINTPPRCAAFLATLWHESRLKYNAVNLSNKGNYRPRGFIQLLGKLNYIAAKEHLGHDFVATPDDAATLAWAAKLAGTYWTVIRPNSNAAADALDMGRISRYIGYGNDPGEDNARCAHFKAALQHFTGSIPTGIVCLRHK